MPPQKGKSSDVMAAQGQAQRIVTAVSPRIEFSVLESMPAQVKAWQKQPPNTYPEPGRGSPRSDLRFSTL